MLNSLITRINQAPVWRRSVEVWGRRVEAPTFDRLLALWLHRLGVMGAKEQAHLRRLVRPGMRVADIGANQGLYSLLLAELAGPEGEVLSFEPQPELNAALRRNIEANGVRNIRVYNQAVGARPGTAVLQESPFNSGDNRIGEWGEGRTFEIEIQPLDELLADNPRVDFIKIDVQGYELAAFEGMTGILGANPDIAIVFEFWPHGLRAQNTSPRDLLRLLADHGFTLYEFKESGPVSLGDGREGHDALINRIKDAAFVDLLATRRPLGEVWR